MFLTASKFAAAFFKYIAVLASPLLSLSFSDEM